MLGFKQFRVDGDLEDDELYVNVWMMLILQHRLEEGLNSLFKSNLKTKLRLRDFTEHKE